MKTIATLIFLSIGSILFAQDKINLIIFSEDGFKFYAFVNGIQQNKMAESNLNIKDISSNLSLRLEFEDKNKTQIKQDMNLESGFEHSLKITQNSKKQFQLQKFGQTKLSSLISPENTSSDQNNSETKAGENVNSNNTSVIINASSVGISMNMSGMENMQDGALNSTITNTTSNTKSNATKSNSDSKNEIAVEKSSDCKDVMSASSFTKVKETVASKPFSDTKLSTAKVATKNKCLSIEQIKEICNLFKMDDEKLDFAKYAYPLCSEKNNYYLISDVFSISSSNAEMNAFLEKQ